LEAAHHGIARALRRRSDAHVGGSLGGAGWLPSMAALEASSPMARCSPAGSDAARSARVTRRRRWCVSDLGGERKIGGERWWREKGSWGGEKNRV
jgi:hypothetical protein